MDVEEIPEDVMSEIFNFLEPVEVNKLSHLVPTVETLASKYLSRQDRITPKIEKLIQNWDVDIDLEDIVDPGYICGFFLGIKNYDDLKDKIPILIENDEVEIIDFCLKSHRVYDFEYKLIKKIFEMRKSSLYWLADKYFSSSKSKFDFHIYLISKPKLTNNQVDAFLREMRSYFPRYLRRSFSIYYDDYKDTANNDSLFTFASRSKLPLSSESLNECLFGNRYYILYRVDFDNLKRHFRIKHFRNSLSTFIDYLTAYRNSDFFVKEFAFGVLKSESSDLFTMTMSIIAETQQQFFFRFQRCKYYSNKSKLFEVILLAILVYGFRSELVQAMINSISNNKRRRLKRYLIKQNIALN